MNHKVDIIECFLSKCHMGTIENDTGISGLQIQSVYIGTKYNYGWLIKRSHFTDDCE